MTLKMLLLISSAILSIQYSYPQENETRASSIDQPASQATTLHEAIAAGNVQRVRDLIATGANLDAPQGENEGRSLHIAAFNGQTEILNILLAAGASINSKDKFGCTPLHIAVQYGKNSCVEALLNASANVNFANNDGRTPIHHAMFQLLYTEPNGNPYTRRQENNTSVKLLMNAHPNLDIQDIEGNTALHYAMQYGHHEYAEIFVKAGADIHLQDKQGNTPLHKAAAKGITRLQSEAVACINILLKAGAPVLAQNNQGNTPLHQAIEANNYEHESFNLLLKAGAAIHSQNNSGNTPLHLAASSSNEDFTKALLKKNVPLEIQNDNQDTPLHIAVGKGNESTVALLVHAGASVHSKGKDRATPLYRLFRNSISAEWSKHYCSILSYLLDNGADTSNINKAQTPIFELAAHTGAVEIVQVLLRNSYRIFCPDKATIESSRTRLRTALLGLRFANSGDKDPKEIDTLGFSIMANKYLHPELFLHTSGTRQDVVNVLLGELVVGGNPSTSPLFQNDEPYAFAAEYIITILKPECTRILALNNLMASNSNSDQRKTDMRRLLTPEASAQEWKELIISGIKKRFKELELAHNAYKTKLQQTVNFLVDDLIQDRNISFLTLTRPEIQNEIANWLLYKTTGNRRIIHKLMDSVDNNGRADYVRNVLKPKGIALNVGALLKTCIEHKVTTAQNTMPLPRS